MSGQLANEIGQRVRRVRHHEDHRLGCSLDKTRHDVPIDLGIGIQEPQPACRIAAVGSTTGAFIDAGSNHNQVRAGEIVVVTFDQRDGR